MARSWRKIARAIPFKRTRCLQRCGFRSVGKTRTRSNRVYTLDRELRGEISGNEEYVDGYRVRVPTAE